MDYTPVICITQGKMRILRTRGALTPYLKLGGCGAVLLSRGMVPAKLHGELLEAMTTQSEIC